MNRSLRPHWTMLLLGVGLGFVATLTAAPIKAQHLPRIQENRGVVKPPRPTAPVKANSSSKRNAKGRDINDTDPGVWAFLNRMFHPNVNFEGTEVSTSGGNGMFSEELIQGDRNGRTRREYLSPGQLRGDIIITTPNQFYHFKSHENRLYLALWPVELVDKAARLRALAKAGRVRIRITGDTTMAGRPAKQITIWSVSRTGDDNEARRVLDIDTENGILLQATRYDSAGRLISTTSLRNVSVGMTIDESRFDPKYLSATAERVPLFPDGQPMFASVEQAHTQVPFTIKEPTQLPPDYTLDGVWVFGTNTLRPSVLLRYSSGVSHFSLFESLVPINPRSTTGAPLLRPGDLRPRKAMGGWSWRTMVPEGQLNMLFTGYLPTTQQEALFRALQ